MSNSASHGPKLDSHNILPPPNPLVTANLSEVDTDRSQLSPMRPPLQINKNADRIQIEDEQHSHFSIESEHKREALVTSFKNLIKLLK